MDDSESLTCRSDTDESFTPCVLWSIAVPLQPIWSEHVVPSTTAQNYLTHRVNGCEGTPWSEEPGGKELHGALGGEDDPELRESTVSCTSSTCSTYFSTSTTSVVLC